MRTRARNDALTRHARPVLRTVIGALWLAAAAAFSTGTCAAPPEQAVGETRPAPEDWPRWRGPRADGTWHGPSIPTKWPEDLTTLWRKPIGGGYSGISVVGDRVYVMDRQKDPEVERVLCLRASDGTTLWKHSDPVEYGKLDYGNGPRAAPTVHKGRVYTLGALGHLNCLDAATGEKVWALHLQNDLDGRRPDWGHSASPYVCGELLIVQPGGANDASVVALELDTGRKVWGALGDQAGYTAPIAIRVEGEEQLVCWTPSHIRAVEPRTGKPLWGVPYEITYGVAIATPVYHQGLVIVCGYWHGSKGIRPGAGKPAELAWEENRYLRGLMSQPLCRGEHVYLLDKQYGLTCFEAATGKKLWDDGNRMTPRGRNPQASIVQLAGSDRILALNSEGELVLAEVTPDGYTEHARSRIVGETWAHPAFAGRRVYARNDTEIVCVELPTGE